MYGQLDTSLPVSETTAMNPINPYGASKMSVENWFRIYKDLYGLDYVCLRYFNVYGTRQRAGSPYSGVIANWVHSIWMKKPLVVYGTGEQTRDFVHVKDVARANVKAIHAPTTRFHTYNISNEDKTSLNTILSIFQQIARHKFIVKYEDAREGEVQDSIGNNVRAKVALEWEPDISIYAGLEAMLQWRGVECKID